MLAQTPREIAGFRVLGVLGQGAGSTIYSVQDPATAQVYTLKRVCRTCRYDQRYIEQAMNEHAVASRIDHENVRRSLRVIRVRQFLRTRELLLLMEMVDGSTLQDLRTLALPDLLQVFRKVARGLHAMHEAGFAHADVKPINVLVSGEGTVKIIDLGQSCRLGTAKERIQGTPDFIAPEQIRRGLITAQTDVYGFGASMYFCVTGQHVPIPGRLVPAGEQPRVLVTPSQINPAVPGALDRLILDCLHQRIRLRPRSMDVIGARLEMALRQVVGG